MKIYSNNKEKRGSKVIQSNENRHRQTALLKTAGEGINMVNKTSSKEKARKQQNTKQLYERRLNEMESKVK